MTTARTKVDALFTTISSHMIEISGAPGTTPEYMAILRQLKTAIWEHTDITREIIPLENGEQNENEQFALSRAVAKTVETDNMIVNFMTNHCDENGHPGPLVNNRMAAMALIDRTVASTNSLKTILHEYKARNDRLWRNSRRKRRRGLVIGIELLREA